MQISLIYVPLKLKEEAVERDQKELQPVTASEKRTRRKKLFNVCDLKKYESRQSVENNGEERGAGEERARSEREANKSWEDTGKGANSGTPGTTRRRDP